METVNNFKVDLFECNLDKMALKKTKKKKGVDLGRLYGRIEALKGLGPDTPDVDFMKTIDLVALLETST